MNQDHKQRLLTAMLKGVPAGTALYRELEEMSIRDLDEIEPVLDQIIECQLKECLAIIAESMTEAQQLSVLARLKERAGFSGVALEIPEQKARVQ